MKIFITGIIILVVGGLIYWAFANEQVNTDENTSPVVESEDPYVGLTLEEATAVADERGVPLRAVEIDGEPLAVTMDWRPGRINVVVENGVVTSYTVEGEEQ